MAGPGFPIQPMTEDDLEEAVALISSAMNSSESQWARKTLHSHFRCREHAIPDGRDYYVWRSEERMVALAGLHHYLWGPEENVWLAWFAVHPEHQRGGIGGNLLGAVEELAVKKGYRKFLVETYSHPDFDNARAFYQANGFRESGRLSDYLPDGSQMVVYAKRIGSGG